MSRKAKKDSSIFSISMIDVFASTMGIFVVLFAVASSINEQKFEEKIEDFSQGLAQKEDLLEEVATATRERERALEELLAENEEFLNLNMQQAAQLEELEREMEMLRWARMELMGAQERQAQMYREMDRLQSELTEARRRQAELEAQAGLGRAPASVDSEDSHESADQGELEQVLAEKERLKEEIEMLNELEQGRVELVVVALQWESRVADLDLQLRLAGDSSQVYQFDEGLSLPFQGLFLGDTRMGPGSEVWIGFVSETSPNYEARGLLFSRYGHDQPISARVLVFSGENRAVHSFILSSTGDSSDWFSVHEGAPQSLERDRISRRSRQGSGRSRSIGYLRN